MRFPAFLSMFIVKKMRGSHNRFYVKKTKKNTYNHRQLKIVLELSLEDFLFAAKVDVLLLNIDF